MCYSKYKDQLLLKCIAIRRDEAYEVNSKVARPFPEFSYGISSIVDVFVIELRLLEESVKLHSISKL